MASLSDTATKNLRTTAVQDPHDDNSGVTHYFLGGSAISAFRRQALLNSIYALQSSGVSPKNGGLAGSLLSIECRYVYAAHSVDTLSTDSTERLKSLLAGDSLSSDVLYVQRDAASHLSEAAAATATPHSKSARTITLWRFVSPRVGTISPWSSKATDIAKNCGVTDLSRIERARVYGLTFSLGNAEPSLEHLNQARASSNADESDASALNAVYNVQENTVDATSLQKQIDLILPLLHDRMMEDVASCMTDLDSLFNQQAPAALSTVRLGSDAVSSLESANQSLGLALADDEISYLAAAYSELERDPTDAELMMFAQANSEHCRHKIFNASWTIDGQDKPHSLFGMIKNTHAHNSSAVLSAYSDNAAVMSGRHGRRLYAGGPDLDQHPSSARPFFFQQEPIHYLLKVETHNHPTAISPFPGAATGAGGEIRDEGATGKGAKPKAGMTGFSVSNLNISGFDRPWEIDYGKPNRIVSALDIMLEGPIGGAAFNNEFGRPNLCGYFRSFELQQSGAQGSDFVWGYHKPIMIAGGVGNVCDEHVLKTPIDIGACLIVLGGPAMLIGLGGGAASSMASGQSTEQLDFASVQRENPEMERRCQEVIDRCWQLGDKNPIAFIHDVGAGGLSNALPELVKDGGVGGVFSLRDIPCDEPGMAPHEIWCNESQERYVLAVRESDLQRFESLCVRERAPYAVVGKAVADEKIVLEDDFFKQKTVDLPMPVLFGKPPKMHRDVARVSVPAARFDTSHLDLEEAIDRLLTLPTIASKSFLITIGDRTVSGLVARDQMVGPWQVPVADAAVTCSSYLDLHGEAMAVGERTPIAALDAKASARMAIGEAITNLCCVAFDDLQEVVLSANWMAAAGQSGQDASLYEAVEAVGMELCPALGIAIPVGKDSLSMSTAWTDGDVEKRVTSPVSLIATAAVGTRDVRLSVTPELRNEPSTLLLVDLGGQRNRLGASCLAQVYGQLGSEPADLDSAEDLAAFVRVTQQLLKERRLLAYHDRSDGGVFLTLAEMAFASRIGLQVDLPPAIDAMAWLFNEELGAVLQVRAEEVDDVLALFSSQGLTSVSVVASIAASSSADVATHDSDQLSAIAEPRMVLQQGHLELFSATLKSLHGRWHETSYRLQALRDDPESAQQEFDAIANASDQGLYGKLTSPLYMAPALLKEPAKVAILREQGVNSQYEMAAAFKAAGFETYDVHMSDLQSGRYRLQDFQGLAACGGFSYGDVLGAGRGWANSILYDARVADQFADFFANPQSFALGVCNGCQMMSALSSLIPGTGDWPRFVRNRSEQFEARLVMASVQKVQSPWLEGLAGLEMPIVVSHGEGRAEAGSDALQALQRSNQIALRYVDGAGQLASTYPQNPNGSPEALAGLINEPGNVLIMMPHPERVFRPQQFSWYPQDLGQQLQTLGAAEDRYAEYSPWHDIFNNARRFR